MGHPVWLADIWQAQDINLCSTTTYIHNQLTNDPTLFTSDGSGIWNPGFGFWKWCGEISLSSLRRQLGQGFSSFFAIFLNIWWFYKVEWAEVKSRLKFEESSNMTRIWKKMKKIPVSTCIKSNLITGTRSITITSTLLKKLIFFSKVET